MKLPKNTNTNMKHKRSMEEIKSGAILKFAWTLTIPVFVVCMNTNSTINKL